MSQHEWTPLAGSLCPDHCDPIDQCVVDEIEELNTLERLKMAIYNYDSFNKGYS